MQMPTPSHKGVLPFLAVTVLPDILNNFEKCCFISCQRELAGIVRDDGYLCGCLSCNFSRVRILQNLIYEFGFIFFFLKSHFNWSNGYYEMYKQVLSAYEFEQHAGGKTRHPNNHIYLENGKPIYNIIQELKTAPLSRLDEVIKEVAGSSVNEEYFQTWKGTLSKLFCLSALNQNFNWNIYIYIYI